MIIPFCSSSSSLLWSQLLLLPYKSTFALYADRVVFPDAKDPAIVARNVGLMLTVIGIAGVITQLFLIKPLVKRFGEHNLIILGQLCVAAAFTGLVFVSNPWAVVLFTIPIAFGNGINQPSIQSILTRFSNERTRGRLLGLLQSSNSLALIFGPIWAGLVFQNVSPRAPFAIAIPAILAAVILSITLKRRDTSLDIARESPHTTKAESEI